VFTVFSHEEKKEKKKGGTVPQRGGVDGRIRGRRDQYFEGGQEAIIVAALRNHERFALKREVLLQNYRVEKEKAPRRERSVAI